MFSCAPVEMTYAALALVMAGVALVLSGLQPFVGIAAVFVALIGGSYAPTQVAGAEPRDR